MKTVLISLLLIYIIRNFIYVLWKIFTRSKERSYTDFSEEELKSGFEFMENSINVNVNDSEIQEKLRRLLNKQWTRFKNLEFKVDGATFISEQYGNYFNLWWFNHDARNKFGYVGKEIDSEMLDIMTLLNVPQELKRKSIWWFKFTWINIVRHVLKGNKKNELPNDIIKI